MRLSHQDYQPICPIHETKILEYYCEPCKVLICGQCMIDTHRVHGSVKYASDALVLHVLELKKILPEAQEVLVRGEETIQDLKTDLANFGTELTESVSKVSGYFESLREIIDGKEREIVGGMKLHAKGKAKLMERQIITLQQAVECMKKEKMSLEYVTDSESKNVKVLLQESQFRSRIKTNMMLVEEEVIDCKAAFKSLSRLPNFIPDPSIEQRCAGLSYSLPSPAQQRSHSAAVLQGDSAITTDRYMVRERSEAFISRDKASLIPSSKTFSYSQGHPPPCKIIDPLARIETPKSPVGTRKVADTLEPVSEIGTKNLIGPYNHVTAYPCGVCCTTGGTLLVTDSKHHLFRILTSTGKCLETVGTEGKGEGQLMEPLDITLDRAGNVLVVDGKNPGRVQKFSIAG